MLTALPPHAHAISDVRVALGAAIVLTGYLLLVLAKPLARCPRCLGKRVLHPHGKPGRAQKCGLCSANGIIRMPGATTVHRFYWSVIGERAQDRRRKDVAERAAAREDKAS